MYISRMRTRSARKPTSAGWPWARPAKRRWPGSPRRSAKVREGWYATDAELDADGDEEAAAEVRAERDSLDLENDSSWVVVIEGDFLA